MVDDCRIFNEDFMNQFDIIFSARTLYYVAPEIKKVIRIPFYKEEINIGKYNFGTASVKLMGSIHGRFINDDVNKYGLKRLAYILNTTIDMDGREELRIKPPKDKEEQKDKLMDVVK